MFSTYLNSWKLRQPCSFTYWLGVSIFDTTLLPLLLGFLALLTVATFQVHVTPSQPFHDYLFALIILHYGWISPIATSVIVTLQLTHQLIICTSILFPPQPRTPHA